MTLPTTLVDEDADETELQAAVETLDGLATDQHGGAFRTRDTSQQQSGPCSGPVITDA